MKQDTLSSVAKELNSLAARQKEIKTLLKTNTPNKPALQQEKVHNRRQLRELTFLKKTTKSRHEQNHLIKNSWNQFIFDLGKLFSR